MSAAGLIAVWILVIHNPGGRIQIDGLFPTHDICEQYSAAIHLDAYTISAECQEWAMFPEVKP